ncbi:hypothetical protein BGZ70_007663 [Mortierella alpina]|uniref:Uncharacterized protein n=1 Tax=Mortierella alpina TaxID=64518 RepID=A0A9P6M7D9_MORAP|nr:hypothetical protein BGZ70_007663 [Mortierella alpina]
MLRPSTEWCSSQPEQGVGESSEREAVPLSRHAQTKGLNKKIHFRVSTRPTPSSARPSRSPLVDLAPGRILKITVMMEPELMQQLRVDDPMEEPELNLDGLQISSIQVLLEPPASLGADAGEDEDDGFYSPLDHFRNLVKLSMSNSQCQSLEGFPNLPLLRSLLLADNSLSSGFDALAEADLQSLVRLDLRGNRISDVSVLQPLDALENLQHLSVADNEIANQENYRNSVFDVLPQLITVDGLDRDGEELDIDDDEVLGSGDEEGHYGEGHAEREDEGEYQIDDGEVDQDDEDFEDDIVEGQQPPRHPAQRDDESEDLGSEDENDYDDEDEEEDIESQGSDSELEDQENRPVMGGKTTGGSSQVDDEEDDDELDDEDEGVAQQQQQPGSDDEEDDEEEDEEEEEEDEHEHEEEDEEEESPGLAYLLTEDIQDENDEEFEPVNEVDEESEIDSSDDEEYGSRNAASAPVAAASSSSNTNGQHHHKRPRSPTLGSEFGHGPVGLDDNATGFDIDADADATNGFGMAPFDGPATFDDDAAHDTKRQRS